METRKNGRLWEVIMNFNAIRNDYEWRWSLIKIKFRKVDGGWVRRRATLNLAKSPCKVWNSYFLTYFKLDPRGDYFWIGLSHNSPDPHISLSSVCYPREVSESFDGPELFNYSCFKRVPNWKSSSIVRRLIIVPSKHFVPARLAETYTFEKDLYKSLAVDL